MASRHGRSLFMLFEDDNPKVWKVEFNGTSTLIDGASEASIDNLHSAALTMEGWFRTDAAIDTYTWFFGKGAEDFGWHVYMVAGTIYAYINCAIAAALKVINFVQDGEWHHVSLSYDAAGTRKAVLHIDGVPIASEVDIAANGDPKSDAAAKLYIGVQNASGAYGFLKGAIGWQRLSNSIRYTGTFTPPARTTFPAVDANTVRLFKMNEGSETTIIDYSANAQNATLANGTWVSD